MLSGALSPNSMTGKVQVNYDQSSMSIVLIKDAADANKKEAVNPSQFSEQKSNLLKSYLHSIAQSKQQHTGIAYGGRGPKSALQNRIGLA